MNRIGLKKDAAKKLAQNLNELLANYQIFYMNVRGYHWNIKGNKFFELHVKFEELYNDLFLKIDEIAERVLTLGHTPLHTFEEYTKASNVKPVNNITNGNEAVQGILDAFTVMIPLQRAILTKAGDTNDEGTNALMSDYIREQEKLVWMYSAYMS